MRLKAILFVAAMIPSAALAQTAKTKPEVSQQQQQQDMHVTVGGFEWSTTQDGRLGLIVIGLNPELRSYFGAPRDGGLLVAHVDANSPAAAAGIRVGDVITKLGSETAKAGTDLFAAKAEGAQKLPIQLIRDKKPMTVQLSGMSEQKGPSPESGMPSTPSEERQATPPTPE